MCAIFIFSLWWLCFILNILMGCYVCFFFFFFQAEDGIRDLTVTGVQTCALPISIPDPGDADRGGRRSLHDHAGPRRDRAPRRQGDTALAVRSIRAAAAGVPREPRRGGLGRGGPTSDPFHRRPQAIGAPRPHRRARRASSGVQAPWTS